MQPNRTNNTDQSNESERMDIVVVNGAKHKMEMRPSQGTRAFKKMVGRVVAKWIEERNDTLTDCHIHWDEEENDAGAMDLEYSKHTFFY